MRGHLIRKDGGHLIRRGRGRHLIRAASRPTFPSEGKATKEALKGKALGAGLRVLGGIVVQ